MDTYTVEKLILQYLCIGYVYGCLIYVSVVMAQVYVYKIDDFVMREIREFYVWKSAPSGVVPLSLVLSLLEEGS